MRTTAGSNPCACGRPRASRSARARPTRTRCRARAGRGVPDLVDDHRAALAARLLVGAEHEVVEQELAAPVEKIDQPRLAVRALEDVVLLDPQPGQTAPLGGERVVLAGERLLLLADPSSAFSHAVLVLTIFACSMAIASFGRVQCVSLERRCRGWPPVESTTSSFTSRAPTSLSPCRTRRGGGTSRRREVAHSSHHRLVAPAWRAVEPLVHPPEAVQPARVRQ